MYKFIFENTNNNNEMLEITSEKDKLRSPINKNWTLCKVIDLNKKITVYDMYKDLYAR
jgi:hypothetical protein